MIDKPKRPPAVGEFAPDFVAKTEINPQFHSTVLGGLWSVMFFHGSLAVPSSAAAYQAIGEARDLFDDKDAYLFGFSVDPADRERGTKDARGMRYILDTGAPISRLYGVAGPGGVYTPTAFLLDRCKRVVAIEPAGRIRHLLERLRREIEAERPLLGEQLAPVLTVPGILEPELCAELIRFYETQGGVASGHMNTVDGRTVAVINDMVKRRKDAILPEGDLKSTLCDRISFRLVPAVKRFLGWHATRIERYIVACYSAEDAGFFRMHRDNTTPGTAHRKFAVTINLNAEDFDGGELRFPEFGSRTYRPPTGGATVFCCSLLHEVTPVTRGLRYATLPFLYDEAGKRIRDANAASLEPAPADSATAGA